MCFAYHAACRRHCRNYPLRPSGPSERCLASLPTTDRLSSRPRCSPSSSLLLPPPSPFFPFFVSLSVIPFSSLSASHRFRRARLHLRFTRSLSWSPSETNQPDQPPVHPLCLTRCRRSRLYSPPVRSFSFSFYVELLLGFAGMRGCSLASDYSFHNMVVILYIETTRYIIPSDSCRLYLFRLEIHRWDGAAAAAVTAVAVIVIVVESPSLLFSNVSLNVLYDFRIALAFF